MSGLYATERQVCRALLNAIATHPFIKNPQIYYPALVGDAPQTEPVKITGWRLFGGVELLNDGLTLAVFPYHSNYRLSTSNYSRYLSDKSMHFDDRNNLNASLGAVSEVGAAGTIRLVVQLYLRETTFNGPVQIRSDVVQNSDLTTYVPHGNLVQLTDEPQLRALDSTTPRQTQEHLLDVQILPGEEILRDYIPLLRNVVRDIPVLRPFYIRNPTIIFADYPTSNWIREGQNLIFHTAYIVVEYDVVEPPVQSAYVNTLPEPRYTFPKPQEVTVSDGLTNYSL